MVSLAHGKRQVKDNLLSNPTLAHILSPPLIEAFSRQAGHEWRRSFWSPSVTVLTFLVQVLDGAKTLRAAVAWLLTLLAAQGRTPVASPDPSAYCQARQRLPLEVFRRLLALVADQMHCLADGSLWRGHRVWVVDGSSVSMPDTPELQEAFPQPAGQRPGCGFPVAQLVALFRWHSGAIHQLELDRLRPHELTLFRRLWDHLAAGAVVVADRAYAAWGDIARLVQRGVHVVFRLHQRRQADFRAGRRLGPNDRLVTWPRPGPWLSSFGLTREEFQNLPGDLTVRLIRLTRAPRGFRSRTVVVVTTLPLTPGVKGLLDPVRYPAEEILALYRDRWTAELNLRSLKIQLGMDVLRGHTPDVVSKEIVTHLLAYNLIRLLMWQAARLHGRELRRLSFTGTLHRLRPALPLLLLATGIPGIQPLAILGFLLAAIAGDTVPDRPDRMEPRRRKRRPKEYSLLQRPRRWYQLHGDPHAR